MTSATHPDALLVVDQALEGIRPALNALWEEVEEAIGLLEATCLLEERKFEVVVIDQGLLDRSGPFLGPTMEKWPDLGVVVTADAGQIAGALESVRQGAIGYLRKPFAAEELSLLVEMAGERSRRRESLDVLNPFRAEGLVGSSGPICQVATLIGRVAKTDTTVLLEGESGTGKEVVARCVHRASSRKGPFVPVNCGAIPKDLMESELYGHTAGAFSGARSAKVGLIQEGAGGTVFLDEISELDLALQVKLTRTLQEREVRRIGDTTTQRVDVRFVAATNRDLTPLVEQGLFRKDLYFRLSVFPIHLPPLRDHREDIPELLQHYLSVFNKRMHRAVKTVSASALTALEGYSWPGNVRELVNMVERAMVLETGDMLSLAAFPAFYKERPSGFWEPPVEYLTYKAYLEGVTDRAQHRYFTKVLSRFEGNVSGSAKQAGISRECFHRHLKRLGIHASEFRSP